MIFVLLPKVLIIIYMYMNSHEYFFLLNKAVREPKLTSL